MKTQKLLMLLAMLMVIVLAVSSASAKVIFYESFETPVLDAGSGWTWKTSGFGASGPWNDGDWVGWSNTSGKYTGIINTGINDLADPVFINSFGDQVVYIFNNIPSKDLDARLESTAQVLDAKIAANTTYTLKFNTASLKGNEIEYHVQLMAIADGGGETVLSEIRGPIASNDLAANPLALTYVSGDEPANLGERISIRLKKGEGTYQHNVYYDNISLSVDTMNPSPYDGEIVPGGTVDLSWTNMTPNVGDNVYVDVWFGTDPCNITGATSEQVVTGGENVATAQVTAPAGGTYYWQVIAYLGGDAVSDPCESDIYCFHTASDLAVESVDILTPDMVTWSDEPVSLTSDVVDDGASALTYTWTSVPADGVVFTPSANDPNPTVTITKPIGLSVLPITNYGFEDPRDAKDGNGFVPYPDGDRDYVGHLKTYTWINPNWGYHFNGYCGVLNPTTDAYPDEAPEGGNIGFVQSTISASDPYYNASGGLAISTIVDLKPNTNYTLSVKVGNPLYNDAFPGYRVQLLADGGVLVQDVNSLEIEPGTFVTSEITYTSGATVNPGRKLGIRLIAQGGSVRDIDAGDTSIYEVNFDDVKLLSDGDSSYAITLEVEDENNPPKDDTMQIDVFDTPCQATVIGMGIRGSGDVNGDCDVNTEDVQEMAAIWLTDNQVVEPAPNSDGDSGTRVDPESTDVMVDAGGDMLTWSGESVVLTGAVVNDVNVPGWSFDTNANLDISISGGDTLTPTVEITKIAATGDATAVTMTLTVGSTSDSVVIDVYDDACKMAVGLDPLVIDAADFNSDCKTNLEDFAAMALKWLTRSTITEPGVKP